MNVIVNQEETEHQRDECKQLWTKKKQNNKEMKAIVNHFQVIFTCELGQTKGGVFKKMFNIVFLHSYLITNQNHILWANINISKYRD